MNFFKRVLIFVSLFLIFGSINAQVDEDSREEYNLIQFSGIVVEGDSMLGVPGVHVFNPSTGRGTSTNLLGFFSFPVMPGDSLMIAAVGFQREYYRVPEDSTENYTVVVRLSEDTLMLPMLEIIAFPSERVFKEAFLALNVRTAQDQTNMNNNLNDQIMRRLLMDQEDDGSMNHSYYMNQQLYYMEQRYMYRTDISLLDPFAWGRFFKDLESEKKKKQQRQREENNTSGY